MNSSPRRSSFEYALAALVVSVVGLMVLPVPPFLLDTLITLNIAASIILMMMPLYVTSASALSTFPSLLLFTTIFRLSISIASTKQILLHAHAGQIIDTFGNLVVGGSVAVGIVVFVIIALVQFIVVAKGGERVAEVGARFSLDAMPGKQMGIDADLRAGNINKDEAQRRREQLDVESKFNGAMDGAMKFIKGDAIATVIIALVNIIGGICVGMLIHNMAFSDSLSQYTVLTIGDAMVSQIPSLLVSVAAGIVITRVSNTGNGGLSLGDEIGRQISSSLAALASASIMVALFMLVPGFPKLQFLTLSLALGFGAWTLARRRGTAPSFDGTEVASLRRDGALKPSSLFIEEEVSQAASPLRLRCSSDIRERLDPIAFDESLAQERLAIQMGTGIPFPGLRVAIDSTLPESSYAIDVHELRALSGTYEELLQRAREHKPEATLATALVGELALIIRARAGEFVGLQEVQTMLRSLERELPDLVNETHKGIPTIRLTEAMRLLAEEGVSLRHVREILEALLMWSPREKDVAIVVEMIRVEIGRFIVHPLLEPTGELNVVTLTPSFEAAIKQGVQTSPAGVVVNLPSQMVQDVNRAADKARSAFSPGQPMVVLCSQEMRRHVRRLLSRDRARTIVLSYQEVPASVMVQIVGKVDTAVDDSRKAA